MLVLGGANNPFPTRLHGAGGPSVSEGAPDLQKTKIVVGLFTLNSVLLTEGSILDAFHDIWS